MFEMFKKPGEETGTESPSEPHIENTEEITNQTEYITPENPEPTPEPEPCQITKTNDLTQLEELSREEQSLLEEKAQLTNIEVELWQKVSEEIDAKKQRIEGLKQEIPEIRKRCDALTQALNLPINQ